MSTETAGASTDAEASPHAALSVVVDDVHVTYRVYADVRPTLRDLVARRFRPRDYRSVEAVRGVSFTVAKGEAVGLIGRNGSGKSTLLRTIGGLLPPTSGAVYATTTPMLLTVGPALKPDLSGRRNIYLGGSALGLTRNEIDVQIEDIIDFTGLRHAIDLPLRTYSSGMASRLAFGVATAVRPEILLIDEALATGDAEFRRRAKKRVEEIVEDAGTVFLVAHALGEVQRMCDRVLWLDQGQIVLDGPAEEVIEAYREATKG